MNGTPSNGVVDLRFYILSVALGGICAYFARLLAGVIARRIVRDPAKQGTWEQHWMVEPAVEALWFAGLIGAALFFSVGRFEDLGIVAGSAVGAHAPASVGEPVACPHPAQLTSRPFRRFSISRS